MQEPWLQKQVIDFINNKILCKNNVKVFEFGSGYSTIYYAQKADLVISIEHNQEWFNKISEKVNRYSNIKLFNITNDGFVKKYNKQDVFNCISKNDNSDAKLFSTYCNKIKEFDFNFDFIIVDGRARQSCAAIAVDKLNKNGFLLLDDTERVRYQGVIKHIDKKYNFKKYEFVNKENVYRKAKGSRTIIWEKQ
jgi:hypothetical protein